jgi:hypothetical protein
LYVPVQSGDPTVGLVSASGQITVQSVPGIGKISVPPGSGSEVYQMGGITHDASGNDWFVGWDSTTSYLGRISSSGAVNVGAIPNFQLSISSFGGPPIDVVAAPDGTIWIAGCSGCSPSASDGILGVERYDPLTDQFTFLATSSDQDPLGTNPKGNVFGYRPCDLAVTSDGGIYALFTGGPVGSWSYGGLINPNGTLGPVVGFGGYEATSVSSLSDGTLLVGFSGWNPVYPWSVTDPDGTFLIPITPVEGSDGGCVISPGDGYTYTPLPRTALAILRRLGSSPHCTRLPHFMQRDCRTLMGWAATGTFGLRKIILAMTQARPPPASAVRPRPPPKSAG